MTQMPDKRSLSADALKALAESAPQSDHEKDYSPGDPSAIPEDLEEGLEEEAGEVPVEAALLLDESHPAVAASEMAAAIPVSQDPPGTAALRRAAAVDRHTRRVHAHQFKTIMVPLLVTVGSLLLLCGAIMLAGAGGDPQEAPGGPEGFHGIFRKWFPVAAFPVGVILLAGAWYFHRELRRTKAAEAAPADTPSR